MYNTCYPLFLLNWEILNNLQVTTILFIAVPLSPKYT